MKFTVLSTSTKNGLLLEKVEVISYSFQPVFPPFPNVENLLTVIFHSPPGPALIPWGSKINGASLQKRYGVRRTVGGWGSGMVMENLLQMLGQNVHKM